MPRKLRKNSNLTARKLRQLGAHLKARRANLKLSSEDVAEAAGLSRVTLYRIEKGEPTVTMEAYFSVITALGLDLNLIDPNENQKIEKADEIRNQKIKIGSFKQLKKIAWQTDPKVELTPEEILNLYERNWRYVDVENLDEKERVFLKNLLKAFNRERLLV